MTQAFLHSTMASVPGNFAARSSRFLPLIRQSGRAHSHVKARADCPLWGQRAASAQQATPDSENGRL